MRVMRLEGMIGRVITTLVIVEIRMPTNVKLDDIYVVVCVYYVVCVLKGKSQSLRTHTQTLSKTFNFDTLVI